MQPSLGERLAEIEVAEARQHIDSLLAEIERAARCVRASARTVEVAAEAARRQRREIRIAMLALGALLGLVALSTLHRINGSCPALSKGN